MSNALSNISNSGSLYQLNDNKIKESDTIDNKEEKIFVTNQYSNNNISNSIKDNTNDEDPTGLKEEFENIKKEQGFLGKCWDTIKNKCTFLEKLGWRGSENIDELIKKAESGEISEEEVQKEIEKYKSNQEWATEIALTLATVAIVSGVCLLAGPVGVIATLAISGATGAIARAGLGIFEAATNDVEGDYSQQDLSKDLTKGFFIGVFKGLSKVLGYKVSGRDDVLDVIDKGSDPVKSLFEKSIANKVQNFVPKIV